MGDCDGDGRGEITLYPGYKLNGLQVRQKINPCLYKKNILLFLPEQELVPKAGLKLSGTVMGFGWVIILRM